MLVATGSLLVISFVLMATAGFWAWKSYQRHKLNLIVSDELHRILTSAHESVKNTPQELRGAALSGQPPEIMESPELMSTIITVLVHKYGTARLSISDFMIPDGEYVSVYVDTATQEIILSLDHNLSLEEQLVHFTKTDDTTFH